MTNTEILCFVLGWQGGTIHQVAEATGCCASRLLECEPDKAWNNSAYHFGCVNGSNHARHGTHRFLDPSTGKAFPHTYGRLDYWLGVIDGWQEATQETGKEMTR